MTQNLRSFRPFTLIIATLGLALLVACDRAPQQPLGQSDPPTNSDPLDGYTATSEAPAFGDPALMAISSAEEGVDFQDQMATNSSVDSIMRDPVGRIYAVRIIWGNLECDSTTPAPTDWTGGLGISRGAALLARTIRFEEGDFILPRIDRRHIQWVSHTRPCNDGILALLYNPRRPDSIKVDSVCHDENGATICRYDTTEFRSPLVMNFRTGPLSVHFTDQQLEALDTVIAVGDRNAVHFVSTRIDGQVCPRGHLAGGWGVDSAGVGIFRGAWLSPLGDVVGYMRGHWGLNQDSVGVFRGKWISLDGQFEGFLLGRWEQNPADSASDPAFVRAGGRFDGIILNASRVPIGRLRGRYHAGDPAHPHGQFVGKWRLECPIGEPAGELGVPIGGGIGGRELGDLGMMLPIDRPF